MESLPVIPNALLRALDQMFPDQCPRIDDTERMIWFRAGQRSVVDVLVEHHQRQNETVLEKQS